MSFIVIIPSRYQSSRLPGKPLVDICGKTMIQRVAEQALQSGASRVVVASDDVRIEQAVTALGYEVCMTSPAHNSGTERLAEVCSKLGFNDDDILTILTFMDTNDVKSIKKYSAVSLNYGFIIILLVIWL